MIARPHPLPVEHGEPARVAEQLVARQHDPARGTEVRDLLGERIRDRHGLPLLPHRLGTARRGVIVQDQEVAHVEHFLPEHAVELSRQQRRAIGRGEERQQLGNAALDQVDAGRFQWFEEAARQADRDDIGAPRLASHAGREADQARIGERRPVHPGDQRRARRLFVLKAAREDIAVADPVLERDAPAPTRLRRGRTGEGRAADLRRARRRPGPIAGQPVRPVVIAHAQRLADQQAAQPRTVDEEVAGDDLSIRQRQRSDVSAVVMPFDRRDHTLDPGDARAFGEPAQVARVEPGIEVIGIAQRRQQRASIGHRSREAAGARGLRGQRIGFGGRGIAIGARADQAVEEHRAVARRPERAEGVEVAAALAVPADELDAELHRRLGLGHELALVQADDLVEPVDRWDRRLADPDRPDRVGFDQGDGGSLPRQRARQSRGGHPARCAPAKDHDPTNACVAHTAEPIRSASCRRASSPRAGHRCSGRPAQREIDRAPQLRCVGFVDIRARRAERHDTVAAIGIAPRP